MAAPGAATAMSPRPCPECGRKRRNAAASGSRYDGCAEYRCHRDHSRRICPAHAAGRPGWCARPATRAIAHARQPRPRQPRLGEIELVGAVDQFTARSICASISCSIRTVMLLARRNAVVSPPVRAASFCRPATACSAPAWRGGIRLAGATRIVEQHGHDGLVGDLQVGNEMGASARLSALSSMNSTLCGRNWMAAISAAGAGPWIPTRCC